jgi:hypothetical protein
MGNFEDHVERMLDELSSETISRLRSRINELESDIQILHERENELEALIKSQRVSLDRYAATILAIVFLVITILDGWWLWHRHTTRLSLIQANTTGQTYKCNAESKDSIVRNWICKQYEFGGQPQYGWIRVSTQGCEKTVSGCFYVSDPSKYNYGN